MDESVYGNNNNNLNSRCLIKFLKEPKKGFFF